MAKQLAARIDAAVLKPDTTAADVAAMCAAAKAHGFRAVEVLPVWVRLAHGLLASSPVLLVSVVGYPLGGSTTETKVAEAAQLAKLGAQEIDMMMALGKFKSGDAAYVKGEIAAVVQAAGIPVKVIIETGYLSKAEIAAAAALVQAAGAAGVKTCSGWGPRGVTPADVRLIRQAVSIPIKAAGGIRTAKQAAALLKAGATELGTSTPLALLAQ